MFLDLAGGDAHQLMGAFARTLAAISPGASTWVPDLYRQYSKPHDLRHRGRRRDRNAEFFRFQGMVECDTAAGVEDHQLGLFRVVGTVRR
jgi:hypothetical protein